MSKGGRLSFLLYRLIGGGPFLVSKPLPLHVHKMVLEEHAQAPWLVDDKIWMLLVGRRQNPDAPGWSTTKSGCLWLVNDKIWMPLSGTHFFRAANSTTAAPPKFARWNHHTLTVIDQSKL